MFRVTTMDKQKDKDTDQLNLGICDTTEESQDFNGESEEHDFESIFSEIFSELENQIPSKSKVEVKGEKNGKNKIDDYNNDIIKMYLEGEHAHLKGQKPVSIIIAIAVLLQIIAFNVLIFIVSLRTFDSTKLELLLDFMKYYTGAVIVEMLGLCIIIVKGVFSMSLGKMVEHILKKKKDL